MENRGRKNPKLESLPTKTKIMSPTSSPSIQQATNLNYTQHTNRTQLDPSYAPSLYYILKVTVSPQPKPNFNPS